MDFIVAHSRYRRRRFQEAIAICDQLLKNNPRDQAAWVLKCQCLIQDNFVDELETEEEGMAELMIKDETSNQFARPGTSFRATHQANPIARPLHSGLLNTGFQRAATRASSRTGSRNNMLRTGRIMTNNGVPTTANGRVLRLATASLAQYGQEFFESGKADLRALGQRRSKSRLVFEYLFYVEHNLKKSLELAVIATEVNNYEDPWWKIALGKCYYHLHFLKEAEQQFVSSLRHNYTVEAYLYLSRIYQQQDSVDKALNVLQQAATAHPYEPKVHLWMGRIKDQLQDLEGAHEHYKRALALQNCNIEAVANMAAYFFYKEQAEIALKFYQRLIELGYESQEVWNNMALCCFNNHQYHLFYPCFQRALQYDEQPLVLADVWYNVGYVYTLLGQTSFAVEAYKAALKHNPSHSESLNNLAVIEAKAGRIDSAINYGEKAFREQNTFEGTFNLSLWYFASNQLEKAHFYNKEALKLYPSHAESLELSTRLLRKLDTL